MTIIENLTWDEGTMAEKELEESPGGGSGVDANLARHGGLTYLEIPAIDARLSAAFYESVVGWNLRDRDSDDPRFSDSTGHLIGRWVTGRAISAVPGLIPYIYVDDINEAVEKTVSNGGEVVRAPYPEGNLSVATIRDPAGNLIGFWQQGLAKPSAARV